MNDLTKKQSVALQVKAMLNGEQASERLAALFTSKDKLERFKVALYGISQNDILKSCTPQSIIKAAFDLADLGLEINPLLNQSYIVKYSRDAQPIISYKGWITLLNKAGKYCKAFAVFKCDTFEMDLSDFDERITFLPNFTERKSSDDKWFRQNLTGILVKIKDNNTIKNHFIQADKLEKIRTKSPSANSTYSPYNQWAEEMYLAKAIKYCLSRESLGESDANIAKAINIDNQLDLKYQQEAETKKEQSENLDYIEQSLNDEIQIEPVSENEQETI